MVRKCVIGVLLVLTAVAGAALRAQTSQRGGAPPIGPTPTHADILRGEYGRYRGNNDLLFYDLDIRVDPDKKFVTGRNTIRFKMLKDDSRIQLDLYDNLKVDEIVFTNPKLTVQPLPPRSPETRLAVSPPLKYERDSGAVLIDFPATLK